MFEIRQKNEKGRRISKTKSGNCHTEEKLIEWNDHITTEICHENKITFIPKTKSL